MVVSGCGYFLGGGGWWWMMVGGDGWCHDL